MALIYNALEAWYLFSADKRDEAVARLARAFEIEPNFWVAHLVQARFWISDNDPERAIAALQRADALADQSTQPAALLGMVLAQCGRIDAAQAVCDRLQKIQETRYVPPTSIAAVCAALGETDQAMSALERAFVDRDTRLVFLKDDARWAALRGMPRFDALRVRMQLHACAAGIAGP